MSDTGMNNHKIVKAIVAVFAIFVIAFFCFKDGYGYRNKDYVRYKDQDIALYHDDEGAYLFLPGYIPDGKIKYSEAVRKSDPQIVKYTGLPTIFVETAQGNLDKVYSDKEYKETGRISVYDTEGKLLYSGGLEYIKGRGNYSWASEEWTKKPFSINLKREASLLGQPSGTKYALIANASDDTLIRNHLARRLQEDLGVRFAVAGLFTGLYIDGDFMGIYYLCVPPEISAERIDIDASGTDITGGYLLEREYDERFVLDAEKYTGSFITKGNEHFIIHTPRYATDKEVDYIRNYMNDVESAIMSADGSDESGRTYSDYIDEESFVLTYITEEIIKNYDGGVSSAFYYKDSDSTDGRLYCAPGWDYDMSLGNYQDWMDYDSPLGFTELYPHTDASGWYKGLLQKNEFRELFYKIYHEKRDDIEDVLCGDELMSVRESLNGAYKAEYLRWKTMYDGRGAFPGSDEAYDKLIEFSKQRIDFFDEMAME